ncbi:MAG: EF-hand domain-containing protein [Verrucomicrobiota bacterium]
MLKLFDLNGDGRISEQERQAVREVWEEHLREKAAEAASQAEAPTTTEAEK